MTLCEAIIAYDTAVNAETATLSAVSPTTLTIRPESYGKARITHAMALTSTDDVAHVVVIPAGYNDSNGFEIPYIVKYSNTTGFDLVKAKLPAPIEVPNNTDLVIKATSETAANSVVFVWLWLEYSGEGAYIDIGNKPQTVRELDAGASLSSLVETSGTTLTSLLAGRKYQLAGLSGVGVDGQTAGIVGPAFVNLTGPAEYSGMNAYLPLPNNPAYATGSTWADLKAAGIKQPVFSAPNQIIPKFLDYTAERPTAKAIFMVDKVF